MRDPTVFAQGPDGDLKQEGSHRVPDHLNELAKAVHRVQAAFPDNGGPVSSPAPLSREHREVLLASGLRLEVINSRGYWTAPQNEIDLVKQFGHSSEIVRHGAAL